MARSVNILLLLFNFFPNYPKLFTEFPEVACWKSRHFKEI